MTDSDSFLITSFYSQCKKSTVTT